MEPIWTGDEMRENDLPGLLLKPEVPGKVSIQLV